MYKKILVPIDGSPTSKRGLTEAMRLAKHPKSRLRLIHVVGLFIPTPKLAGRPYCGDVQKFLRETGSRILKQTLARVRKRGFAADALMFEIVTGSVASEIVKQAKKWRADIIVIGTHGRRGVLRLVMGSDAEEVVRTSPVPVLLVRPKRSGH